jgi:hypothetical protein
VMHHRRAHVHDRRDTGFGASVLSDVADWYFSNMARSPT